MSERVKGRQALAIYASGRAKRFELHRHDLVDLSPNTSDRTYERIAKSAVSSSGIFAVAFQFIMVTDKK